jgi:hypothetical protein
MITQKIKLMEYQCPNENMATGELVIDSNYGLNLERLIRCILPCAWQWHCQIIEGYMPPFPNAETLPKCVIQYKYKDRTCFLRYSAGPRQGYFWDVYGDDFQTAELALIALHNADCPEGYHHNQSAITGTN